jgi:hypothetical protein
MRKQVNIHIRIDERTKARLEELRDFMQRRRKRPTTTEVIEVLIADRHAEVAAIKKRRANAAMASGDTDERNSEDAGNDEERRHREGEAS